MAKVIKNKKVTKKQLEKKSARAFQRFVDFMYENPQMMKEFPKKIIFTDQQVKMEFS